MGTYAWYGYGHEGHVSCTRYGHVGTGYGQCPICLVQGTFMGTCVRYRVRIWGHLYHTGKAMGDKRRVQGRAPTTVHVSNVHHTAGAALRDQVLNV